MQTSRYQGIFVCKNHDIFDLKDSGQYALKIFIIYQSLNTRTFL